VCRPEGHECWPRQIRSGLACVGAIAAMLLQSMLIMAVLAILADAALLSSLASARIAMHEAATRNVQIALARGANDFTRWAAGQVYKNTASGAFPVKEETLPRESVCGRSVAGQSCALFATISYRVTGSTSGSSAGGGRAGSASADNLQTLVDEQRISAEVIATIATGSGTVLAVGTRQLTARAFDVPPWVIITGTRDISTVLGSIRAAQGDTGGQTNASAQPLVALTPDPLNPASFQDTSIRVTMTCTNSTENADSTRPTRDNNAPGNENMPWGVQAQHGAYEAPCQPTYGFSEVPADAMLSNDGNYDVGAFETPKPWSNGSPNVGAPWPQ
jgi:hypothetical protein